MAKFVKDSGSKELPAISTASLPDIVFMLLFFFIVAGRAKEKDPVVSVSKPRITEAYKISKDSEVDYIFVGVPRNAELGTSYMVQLDDDLNPNASKLRLWKQAKIDERDPGKRDEIITALKIDKESNMRIVTEVKDELREINALKIVYSADLKKK